MGRFQDIYAKIHGKEPYISWGDFIKRYILKKPFDDFCLSLKKRQPPFGIVEEGNYKIITIDEKISLFWPAEYGWKSVFSVWKELFFDNPGNYFSLYSPKEGEVVFDVGASEGLFALKIRDVVGEIHLFEPLPRLCDALRMTFEGAIASGQIFICPFALGTQKGTTLFRINSENLGGSHLARTGEDNDLEVSITTIDDYVEENAIGKIDLIKMDIEGAELNALKGAEKTIRSLHPRLLICTYHKPDDPENIGEFIKTFGYRLHYSSIIKFGDDRPIFRPAFIYAIPSKG